MTKLIDDHWFRTNDGADGLCVHPDCAELPEDHVEVVGEWMDPRHFYVPLPGGCGRCGRHWRHSTHRGSPHNRRMWLRPKLSNAFFNTKDRLLGYESCLHLSHRLYLPCLRRMDGAGLCEVHYDDCEEGCP